MDKLVEGNRAIFLFALRSGIYPKCNTFEFDSKGRPPSSATGYCTLGLAYTLFGGDTPFGQSAMRNAVDLQQWQFIKIQEEWNNSQRTFSEIADLIEVEMF